MMTMVKEGSTNSVNFMSPRAGILMLGCRHITHIVEMYYFLKNQPLNFFWHTLLIKRIREKENIMYNFDESIEAHLMLFV